MRSGGMHYGIAARNQPGMIPLTKHIAVVVKHARWPDDEAVIAWLWRWRFAIQIRFVVEMHKQERIAPASMAYHGWAHGFVQSKCFDMDPSLGGLFAIVVELRNRHAGSFLSGI